MNVAELIELLNKQPSTMRVVMDGYEGGIEDIDCIKQIPILLNKNDEWYYGPHEECDEDDEKLQADEIALKIFGAENPNWDENR